MSNFHIDLSQFNFGDTLIALLAFIVLIGVMVLVHEAGHFLVAKACRVRVEAFSFGFGPRLFGWKYGETDYRVSALPLGGYVKMTGETPGEDQKVDDPGAFMAHPRWQRMLIGVAGPAANMLLAFALMGAYFFWINEVPKNELKTTTVEWVVPGSAAAKAGIEPGDVIRRIANVDNPGWDDFVVQTNLAPGQTLPVTVERGGRQIPGWLAVPEAPRGEEILPSDLGLLEQYTTGGLIVAQVQPGTPAEQAGLRAGDQVVSVNGQPVHSVPRLWVFLEEAQGHAVMLGVVRQGETLNLEARAAKLDGHNWRLGFTNEEVLVSNPLSLGKSLTQSRRYCKKFSFFIVEVLGRLVSRQVPASQLAGPIGIARMAGQTAKMGKVGPMLVLGAEISINLGILNLLPFPILDGGMILFLLIESAIRRDISMAVKERIYQAAFVLIVAFFAFVVFNDVSKLPIFTHVK